MQAFALKELGPGATRSDRENADREAGDPYDQPDKDPDPLVSDELPLLRVFAVLQKMNEIDDKTGRRNAHRELCCAVQEEK